MASGSDWLGEGSDFPVRVTGQWMGVTGQENEVTGKWRGVSGQEK